MFVILVQVQVRPEHLPSFTTAIAANAAASVAHDPGCLRFEVLQQADDPTRWVFYEVYASQDAWEAHRASPHFLAYKAVADVALVSRTATPLTPRFGVPAS